MKKQDVPQDNNSALGGERKAMYAVDENGEYTVVASSGWEVEETVTSLAVEHYQELAEEALQQVQQGMASPLRYHMFARRFNVDTLAQTTGLFQWQVKRHFKPKIFSKLDAKILARYATAMGISVEQLQSTP
ncbi:MAG: hypothetical protein LJE85_08655 [Gammaproteobacteria bacterium]|jgi:hypothetical protein|nr:hypothetical protein [Gammaproteobacteria bacterium]